MPFRAEPCRSDGENNVDLDGNRDSRGGSLKRMNGVVIVHVIVGNLVVASGSLGCIVLCYAQFSSRLCCCCLYCTCLCSREEGEEGDAGVSTEI